MYINKSCLTLLCWGYNGGYILSPVFHLSKHNAEICKDYVHYTAIVQPRSVNCFSEYYIYQLEGSRARFKIVHISHLLYWTLPYHFQCLFHGIRQ